MPDLLPPSAELCIHPSRQKVFNLDVPSPFYNFMFNLNNEQMSSYRIRVHIISSVATTALTVK